MGFFYTLKKMDIPFKQDNQSIGEFCPALLRSLI